MASAAKSRHQVRSSVCSCLKTLTRRGEVMEVSISMCKASRLKSSTTLNVRKRRPLASVSLMKSPDHTASGRSGTYRRHTQALGQSPFGASTQMQAHLLVYAVDPLVIPGSALASEELATLPESTVGASLDQRNECSDDLRVSHRPVSRHSVVGRSMQSCACAGLRDG